MDLFSYLLGKNAGGGGGGSVEIHNMAYLFYNGNRVEDITNVLKLCRNVTNFSHAFEGASNMTSVSLEGVTAGENVTLSDSIFSGCTTLVTADLTNFITTSFKGLYGMFYRCFKLKNVNFAGCDFSKVTTFASMFYYCQELENIDLSMLENGNTYVQVNAMFSHCTSMKHIDLRNFNFNRASFGSSMFDNTFPTDCEIIVKDATQKQWFATYYPSFTNVKTVDEL